MLSKANENAHNHCEHEMNVGFGSIKMGSKITKNPWKQTKIIGAY